MGMEAASSDSDISWEKVALITLKGFTDPFERSFKLKWVTPSKFEPSKIN